MPHDGLWDPGGRTETGGVVAPGGRRRAGVLAGAGLLTRVQVRTAAEEAWTWCADLRTGGGQ